MPRRPTAARRWRTAATWPVGVALTSWDYMWRSTPMHRRERHETDPGDHLPPPLAQEIDRTEIVGLEAGRGPLFHRRYCTLIRGPRVSPERLLELIAGDPNRAAPTKFARFQKVLGEVGNLAAGDEFVVRMPGPWDGPVRVVEAGDRSFRLATLEGHLEAGQIEFRVDGDDPMRFEIESWARSADRFADLLYHRVRMAKEVQLHMWTSFLEGAVKASGGRMTGGVEIDTRLIEAPFPR
jgi:hypothetical protein